MQTKMDEMTELMKTLSPAQNQPPLPLSTQADATISVIPGRTIPVSTPPNSMPEGRPWGVPICLREVFRPIASEVSMPTLQYAAHVPLPDATVPPTAMIYSAPMVNAFPEYNKPIFHLGSVGAYDRVDELQEKYDEMQREMRALRGKEVLGKTAYDLCLVLNVQIPHKFKLPNFEKYKGNS
jgi:hypothetical protein